MACVGQGLEIFPWGPVTEATATTTELPAARSLSDSQPEPAWLTHLNEKKMMPCPSYDEAEWHTLVTFRTMFQAPGDDAVAAKNAA